HATGALAVLPVLLALLGAGADERGLLLEADGLTGEPQQRVAVGEVRPEGARPVVVLLVVGPAGGVAAAAGERAAREAGVVAHVEHGLAVGLVRVASLYGGRLLGGETLLGFLL